MTPEIVRLSILTAQRKCMDAQWRKLIREASENHSLRTVASHAGVSHATVAQIVKQRPTD